MDDYTRKLGFQEFRQVIDTSSWPIHSSCRCSWLEVFEKTWLLRYTQRYGTWRRGDGILCAMHITRK